MFASQRILLTVLIFLVAAASSFSPTHLLLTRPHCCAKTTSFRLWDATSSTDPSEMKLREIQAELKDMGISYSDCFDRESLTRRLNEARNGEIAPAAAAQHEQQQVQDAPRTDDTVEAETSSSTSTEVSSDAPDSVTSPPPQSDFDREETLTELRSLRVKELRTELAKRNIRWGNMVEKEDLVQALLKAREASSHFSSSGALSPGKVADINGNVLQTELSTPASTPLLLDVYATWCGPCRMQVPELQMAADELGDTVRVAKIDSDKYPEWASQLRVGGLPTLIVFDGEGTEVERVEGALMKDGLVQLARKNM